MSRRAGRSTAPTPRALSARLRAAFAARSADRHLAAYILDRHPRHIANAWREFRAAGAQPGNGMLAWIDLLAERVLNPDAARVRPKTNTVRDVEIWRLVCTLRADPKEGHRQQELMMKRQGLELVPDPEIPGPLHLDQVFAIVARGRGLKPGAVKAVYFKVERALRDPYYLPRAFR